MRRAFRASRRRRRDHSVGASGAAVPSDRAHDEAAFLRRVSVDDGGAGLTGNPGGCVGAPGRK